MSMSPIDIAKVFLANNAKYSYLENGTYTVSDHDTAMDAHTINMLPGVDSDDTRDNDYHVVTVEKNVPVEGHDDVTIPKIVKIQISKTDNSIQSVLESK